MLPFIAYANESTITSLKLTGDTFDTVTYGKDIMLLFWDSSLPGDSSFKSKVWDRLHRQRNDHVRSSNITVGEMNCHLKENHHFCTNFITFSVRQMEIAYSYNNEPFKQYNQSMSFSSLTTFMYDYFERNCVYNDKWCTKEEKDRLTKFRQMTLSDKLKKHMEWKQETESRIQQFETWRNQLRTEFTQKLHELHDWTDERDRIAQMYLYDMHEYHSSDDITEKMSLLKTYEL